VSAISAGAPSLTEEIRFWWPNGQTGVLSAWLEEKGVTLSVACERTDIYIPTGSSAVNLKKRGGEQWELKTLVRKVPLVVAFAGQQECELWVKHEVSALPVSDDRQLKVTKTRWLACLDPRGEMTTGEQLAAGCQVELSEVRPEGAERTWTSFCLEAFGDTDGLAECLQAVIARLGDVPCANERPLIASYAEWLSGQDYFDRA
jgi:hypothetical protein